MGGWFAARDSIAGGENLALATYYAAGCLRRRWFNAGMVRVERTRVLLKRTCLGHATCTR